MSDKLKEETKKYEEIRGSLNKANDEANTFKSAKEGFEKKLEAVSAQIEPMRKQLENTKRQLQEEQDKVIIIN